MIKEKDGRKMRIVAGKAKGIHLQMVPGKQVRPTTDRVKESLFQLIGPFFAGGDVLDLFAGSGALGMEALSRGCAQAIFVDRARASVQTIRQNLHKAGLSDQAIVIQRDAFAACRWLAKQQRQFALIFLDPPYHFPRWQQLFRQLEKGKLLQPEGLCVVETASPVDCDVAFSAVQSCGTLHAASSADTAELEQAVKDGTIVSYVVFALFLGVLIHVIRRHLGQEIDIFVGMELGHFELGSGFGALP